MRELAQRLLAVEAASRSATHAHLHEAVRVCEKLRTSLTRFAGADGFTSLLRRALVLARSEVPLLLNVEVEDDGGLRGLDELAAEERNGMSEATVAMTGHLLGLLVTFVGEPITLRLVREAWPNASLDD